MTDTETVARKIISLMVTRFGVRPNGSVQIRQLTHLAQDRLNLTEMEVAAGIAFAVEKGWVVQQENGLIRITTAGFAEA